MWHRWSLCVFLLCCLALAFPQPSIADASGSTVEASPIEGWDDFSESDPEPPLWRQILLWPVNRVIDIWDIFRVDVGVGPSIGGVARITKYGQFGARVMQPASFRIGDFGRRPPYLMEKSNEFGIGPFYASPGDREVCRFELGAGLDIILFGGYGGICLEELYDFAGGIFLFDPLNDDFE